MVKTHSSIPYRPFKYNENSLIEAAISRDHLDIKYYLQSFMKNIEKKMLVNYKDILGRPAIFYSAFFNDTKSIHLLLRSGFDLRETDKCKRNLLHFLAVRSNAAMIQAISEHLLYLKEMLRGLEKKEYKSDMLKRVA